MERNVMSSGFALVVEEVQKLSLQEKEDLRLLLEKYLMEERRKEIYDNYQTTVNEEKSGYLKKPVDIKEFKRMIKE